MGDGKVARRGKSVPRRATKRPQRTGGSGAAPSGPNARALEEARQALNELHPAEDELRNQNEGFAGGREALEIEERRKENRFEFGPDAYLVTDLQGIIREANSTAEALLLVPQYYLIGKPLANFVARRETRDFRSRLLQLRGEGVQTWEIRLRRRGGAEFDGEITVAPFHAEKGQPTSVLRWVLRDVSERERAQQQIRSLTSNLDQIVESTARLDASNRMRSDFTLKLTNEGEILQAIMDNTHAQLAYLDPQFNFVLVNAAYERGSGHSKEELIGRNHFDLFPNAEILSVFERVRDHGEGAEFFDKPFIYVDQPERGVTHWNWTCVPVKNAAGHVQGLVLSLLDVTETVRAQQAEREHALKITAILESITDSYIALDREWRFTDVNPAAERTILRRPRQELLGKVIWDEFPIIGGGEFQRQFQIALAEQRPVHFEAATGPTGLWYEALASPTREGLSVYLRDITERKRDEELNARLAAIIESSEDAIIGLTYEGMILSWNPAAERLFGYSAAEISGKPVSILYPPDHPDEFPQVMQQLKLGERIEHYETQRVCKDGTQIEVALSMSPIKDPSGKVIGAAKIARNITAQKRARESEHFLAEASAVLASSLDYEAALKTVARLTLPFLADYCVVDIVQEDESLRRVTIAACSPAQERLLGELMARYPVGAEAMGEGQVLKSGLPRAVWEMPDSTFGPVADDPELARILRELDPKSFMIVPMIARGRTLGTIILGMAASSHRYDEADLEVAEDLARRAAYAVDNARLYYDSQAAVSARDRFLSLASHEVRTPLTVIQGYTQLLMQQAEQFGSPESLGQLDYAKLMRGLRNIEYSAARLEALMSDLLDITRLPSRALSISPERMNLSESLTRVVESVRGQRQHQQRSSRVALSVEMANSEVWGEWDRVRLEQVLTNLVDNAIKYSPRGGAIWIRLAVEDEAGRAWAHLLVSDQGIGIPAAELGKILKPFMRATNAVEREYPGLGIGLAVSKEIVNRHGGRIWVESKGIDQGSTFHVMLPMSKP